MNAVLALISILAGACGYLVAARLQPVTEDVAEGDSPVVRRLIFAGPIAATCTMVAYMFFGLFGI